MALAQLFSLQMLVFFVASSSGSTENYSVYNSTEGMIYSPNFTNKLLNGSQTYRYRIEANTRMKVYLAFSYVNFYDDVNCSTTSLLIYEGADTSGTPRERRCGSNSTAFISETNVVTLKFTTVRNTSLLPADHGFVIYYTSGVEGCNKLFTSSSGSIQSPLYPNNYPNNTICTYNITVEEGHMISFANTSISLRSGDSLEVFDLVKSELIARNLTSDVSYSYYSTSNSLLFTFRSNSIYSSRGFILRYSATKGCNYTQTLYSPSNWSPFYPLNYPSNIICNFTFKLPLVGNYNIFAYLPTIDIQESTSCEEGSLSVYDGKGGRPYLMDKLCGVKTAREYVTQGDTLIIQLKATNSSSRGGFQAYMRAIQAYCNFHYFGTTKLFSPNYPYRYPHLTTCRHTLTNGFGGIMLKMLHFDLEFSENCVKDSLKIYVGSRTHRKFLSTRCGNDTTQLTTNGNEIYLLFTSNSTTAHTGYIIEVEFCGGWYYAPNGKYAIKSPGYPEYYTNNTNCRYRLHGRLAGFGMRLEFNQFDIEDSNGCQSDSVTIYKDHKAHSNIVAIKCGSASGDIIVQSQYLLVVFRSNSQISNKGFKINVEACSKLFTNKTGTITSPGFPSRAPRYLFCTYAIRLQKNLKIQLVFHNFSINDFYPENYLKIYDGRNSSAPLVATLRGFGNKTVSSTGNNLFMEFNSDWYKLNDNQWYGFELTYFAFPGFCSENLPCENNATCTDVSTDDYLCYCTVKFTGRNCSEKIIPCKSNPCLNGGVCSDIYSNQLPTYLCTCTNGYVGDICENDVDECATGAHKCHVQARCLNTPGSYECKCLDNLSGNGYICNERAAFKDDPTTQRVKTNSIVTLSCSYYNSSSVEFHWIKDGQVLNTSKYITEVKSTRGSQNVYTTKHDLKFNISSIAQQGRYWCRLREGSTVQKDSRIAAVILKDASATELPMEIKKTYNKLWNDTGSPEHQELKGWITDAIKKSVGTGSLASRKRRNVQNSDPFVQLTNIRSSSSGTTLLNAMVYYKTATRDSRLAVCNAMQNISSSPLSTSSIQITVTARKTYDCCYSDFTGNPDIKGVIYWPTQVINERSIVGCPATITKANATRYCVSKDFEEEPVWQSPNTSTCLYVRETTQKLSDLTKATVNATTVVKIVKELEEVTKNETNIKTYLDVAFAVDVIVNVADSQSNNTEAFDGIMNVTSSLMSADANVVKDAQKDNNASARLMKAVEKFADNIPLGQNETTKIFSKKNLAIGITEITAKAQQDLETSGFVIKGNIGGGKTSVEMIKEKNEPVEAPAKVADLKLPGPLFKVAKRIRAKSNATDALRVTTLLYDNAKLFSSESTSGTNASKKINSKVLAVGIKGIKLENLTEEERVRSEFRVQLESQGLDLCVYWEEIEREWSQRGCRYDGKSATDNKIGKCSCNHMTNFALLLDVTQKPTAPPEGIKEMLKYFTYIGCGLSLAGLTITLLTLCFFKKVRQKPPQKIIMGVCISLILALIAFLVASQHTLRFNEENGVLTPASPVVCLVSSVAIHYFVVCSFLWMAMQSYYLYLSCVKVMNVRSPNILKWMALISFGIPLVIVAIVLGVQNKEVKKFADQEKVNKNQASSILLESNGYVNIVDKSNRICMINGISFYVAYLVPIGLILIINFVFLVLSIRGIFGSAQKTGRKGLSMKRKFRIILSCVTMMGLTWLIGMFAIGPLKIALQVLFTIFNSLQGVLIFLFYCLLNKKVQEEWRACLFGGERSDSSVPSSKKTSVKSSEKRHKRRSLLGKKEHTSSSMQSVSKQDEYKESILALQKDFVGKEYRLEGVFANLEDRRAVLSYMGPLDDSAHGGSNTAPDRDPHLSTTV